MPLNKNEKAELFRLLEEKGWFWQEDAITAPGKTIWLMRAERWHTDLVDLLETMRGRLSRLKRNAHHSSEEVAADTDSLVTVLEAILDTALGNR